MPLSTNCIVYVRCDSATLTDLIGSHTITSSGASYKSTSPGPNCWGIDTTSGYIQIAGVTLPTPCTIAIKAYVPGGAGSDATFVCHMQGSADYFQLYQSSGTNLVKARARSGGTAGDASGGGVTGSAFNNAAGVWTSSTSRQAYLAGTLSGADTTNVTPAGSIDTIVIGSIYDGGTVSSPANGWAFKSLAVWSRTLTQAELDSYFSNPDQVLGSSGPNITTQPSDQTVTAPATASYSVVASASGGGSLSYQWQRSTDGGTNWSNVSTGTGGTTANYTTAATSVSGGNANNGDKWRVQVTETGGTSPGTATSTAALLTVNSSTSGTITTPPLDNNTGTLLASISGWTVNVYNQTTGALVVQKTGQSTNASGILVISDAAIVTGTTYSYECVHATYGRRCPTATAT